MKEQVKLYKNVIEGKLADANKSLNKILEAKATKRINDILTNQEES